MVTIDVELFGNARLLAERKTVQISVANDCALSDIAREVGRRHPALVSAVVREDFSGFPGELHRQPQRRGIHRRTIPND